MTTETTYTCPGTNCDKCGLSPGGPRHGIHDFVPHTHTRECDAEVWRAFGCATRLDHMGLVRCANGDHYHAREQLRLAPIMSAPEAEAAWLGARVLLEEAKRRGWGFGIGPRAVTLTSGVSKLLATTHYDSPATLPAAIGTAFKEAVRDA